MSANLKITEVGQAVTEDGITVVPVRFSDGQSYELFPGFGDDILGDGIYIKGGINNKIAGFVAVGDEVVKTGYGHAIVKPLAGATYSQYLGDKSEPVRLGVFVAVKDAAQVNL